jgi:hypothetical protein
MLNKAYQINAAGWSHVDAEGCAAVLHRLAVLDCPSTATASIGNRPFGLANPDCICCSYCNCCSAPRVTHFVFDSTRALCRAACLCVLR